MGHELNETILKLAELADAEMIVIYTEAFKVYGKLLKDRKKIEREIVTLLDATVCDHFDSCECGCGCNPDKEKILYEWFNIPDKKIISFSILPA